MAPRNSQTHGFKRTSSLLQTQIRKTSETRGFAQSRLLTHWAEIAGDDIAAISRPVEVRYGRSGFGATLTLLTTGANAPILEMQKDLGNAWLCAIAVVDPLGRDRRRRHRGDQPTCRSAVWAERLWGDAYAFDHRGQRAHP